MIQAGVCDALDEFINSTSPGPLVLVSSSLHINEVRNMVSVSFDHPCPNSRDGIWRTKDGRLVMVRNMGDPVLWGENFSLIICSSGKAFTDAECSDLKRWQDAAAR